MAADKKCVSRRILAGRLHGGGRSCGLLCRGCQGGAGRQGVLSGTTTCPSVHGVSGGSVVLRRGRLGAQRRLLSSCTWAAAPSLTQVKSVTSETDGTRLTVVLSPAASPPTWCGPSGASRLPRASTWPPWARSLWTTETATPSSWTGSWCRMATMPRTQTAVRWRRRRSHLAAKTGPAPSPAAPGVLAQAPGGHRTSRRASSRRAHARAPSPSHWLTVTRLARPSARMTAATASGVATSSGEQRASLQKRLRRWTASRTGRPKPLAPTTSTDCVDPSGTAGSQAACALRGSRLLPSASTST